MTKKEATVEPSIRSVELKRCPFCGEQKKIADAKGYDKDPCIPVYWLYCRFCGSSGPHKKNFDDAVIAWNTRH